MRIKGTATAAVAAASLLLLSGGHSVAAPLGNSGGVRAVAPSRPIIILFAYGLYGDPNAAPAGIDPARSRLAVRAVRDLLADSNVTDPVIYNPEAPLFVRSLQESKVVLKDANAPTGEEQVAVGKAVGARFTVFVFVHPPNAEKPGIDLEVLMVDLESRKTWGERCLANAPAQQGRGAAARNSDDLPSSDAVSSAANTIVTKMMSGPLKEYASEATPPTLLPPRSGGGGGGGSATTTAPPTVRPPATPPTTPPVEKPVTAPETRPDGKPTGPETPPPAGGGGRPPTVPPTTPPPTAPTTALPPTVAPPIDIDSQADAEVNQGEQFLKAGDVNGAILSFRRAVNLAPQNLPKRVSLIRAYIAAKRNADAISEARRALTIASPQDRAGQLELTRLLAEAMTQSGDTTAARATYEQIIGAQPGAQWARLGLAELLEKQGKIEEAEALYRAVRQAKPEDRDAALGLARVLATKGDYEGALQQIAASSEGESSEDGRVRRFTTAVGLFDTGTSKVADLLVENRDAYASGTLAREVFYKATAAQSARVTALLSLLKAVPPPPDATEIVRKTYRQRIFAASLLSQGVAALMTQVETGDAAAGSQASVFLNEFRTEMNAVRRAEAGTGSEGAEEETPPPATAGDAPLSR